MRGDYVLQISVWDVWTQAAPSTDTVTVSFTNVRPVADAGGTQVVAVGSIVTLDGSASRDADGDPLAYGWSLVSTPPGSGASLTNANAAVAGFVADLPGAYVASLVVNDGIADSDPANVTVTAVADASAVTDPLQRAIEAINLLPAADFRNAGQLRRLRQLLRLRQWIRCVRPGELPTIRVLARISGL